MINDSSSAPCGRDVVINGVTYRIGELISKGSDGQIYAVQSTDGVDLAVKYFRCSFGDSVWSSAMLEIEAGLRLSASPYTVDVLGYCAIKRPPDVAEVFILMPRLICCTDMQLCRRDVLTMTADICLALQFMSKRGMVHCDVKPANIFFSGERWQLGDFGCVQLKGKCARAGSPLYCSPEAHSGGKCDVRSDIYSLGLVMYRLLNGGKMPFCDIPVAQANPDSVRAAIDRRLNGERIEVDWERNAGVRELLRRMVEYEPKRRFRNPAQARGAIELILGEGA